MGYEVALSRMLIAMELYKRYLRMLLLASKHSRLSMFRFFIRIWDEKVNWLRARMGHAPDLWV
jgi:hypothetical protein